MRYDILEERVIAEGEYILDSGGTVRSTAEKFGVSKSTVHKDLSQKLYHLDERLYKEVRKLLGDNLSARHIRGGEATRKKYKVIKDLSQEDQR